MLKLVLSLTLASTLLACSTTRDAGPSSSNSSLSDEAQPTVSSNLELGAFSISLAVKDIAASRTFYEKLGFEPVMGDPSQNWQILRNGDHVIGLFQGMFEKNIMTFNPGWSQQAEHVGEFTDVREIQRRLEERGLTLQSKADPSTTGPASLTLIDPDGNAILIDQHVE